MKSKVQHVLPDMEGNLELLTVYVARLDSGAVYILRRGYIVVVRLSSRPVHLAMQVNARFSSVRHFLACAGYNSHLLAKEQTTLR